MFGTAGISNMQSKRDEFNFNIKTYFNAQKCNDTNHCIFDEEECNLSKGYCDCIKHYYRNSYNNLCELCPKLEERCDDADCCSSSQYICIDGYCQCDHPACGTGVFVTASQVALSAALIMGIAALAMVVYRLCTRPKYLSARQRAALARSQGAQSSDNISGNDIRASLSSMQIRVINRLRDRPPAYDGSNNNGTCDRSTNTIGATTVSASVITRNHISTPLLIQQQNIDTPPPYINSENTPELELHRPPPYTEIILCPAGYLNESYINTEDTTLNNNENSTSFNNYNNNNNNNNNNSNNNSNNNNNNNNNTVDICPNITINISDNVTTISKERNNKDDVLNNKNDTKVKEDNDNNKNNKVDEKDSNNNENNTR